ncbi:toxin co-regulated pilus biosynthesis Q family protein [Limnohabitans sp.]|uniref:toxin co-regulated pilus biosynthesis Q family protein n=1 Tax=Limnohabitans sp. TaxID=1907725 RepID=UPI00286F0929|nr:toxin co-regulated pilus biosynthesis Q family protein [Limnohabitans sp.]
MSEFNRWFCLALCAFATAATAQTQDPSISATRVALDVEWIRSPRAVLSLDSGLTTQQRAGAAIQGAKPVMLEANTTRTGGRQVWSIEQSEKRLSSALERWAQLAGWQLVWEAERDFVIESNLHLEGEFLRAVGTVMQSLGNTDYPLQAKANSATLTLRISRYQDAGVQ